MSEYKSVLQFNGYIVNEINFKLNELFQKNVESLETEIQIKPIINTKGNEMQIKLITEVFKNAEEKNYPFEINVTITGFFVSEDENPEKYKANAIAILYPYIRSIISTYTANANINAFILPTINVNKLIEEQNEKDVKI